VITAGEVPEATPRVAGHIVILRGLSREARHSEPFVTALSARLPGFAVYCPDMPGTGSRYLEHSPLTIGGIVAGLASHLPAGPFHVVGVSLGGMVALEIARTHAGQVLSVTLVNTSLARQAWPWQRLRLGTVAAAWAGLRHWRDLRAREGAVLGLVSNLSNDERTLDRWVGIQQQSPVALTTALRQLLAAGTYRGPRAAPGVPVLLLASAADRLVSPACSRNIASAWRAPLRFHATAGHDLLLDAPDWCAERVAAAVLNEGLRTSNVRASSPDSRRLV
jgi:pimeloyl-ACP methyl ester carboxylesterase